MEDLIICRCEDVSFHRIAEVVDSGIETSRDVKLVTRACMGICQGRTCRPLVEQIVASLTQKPVPSSSHLTFKQPVRPLLLRDLIDHARKEEKR